MKRALSRKGLASICLACIITVLTPVSISSFLNSSSFASSNSYRSDGPAIPMIDEDFESFAENEQLTSDPNWYLCPSLVPYGATLEPVATTYDGSMRAHLLDTSSSSQIYICMSTPVGSGTSAWWVECEVTWISGTMAFVVGDGPDQSTDRLLCLGFGSPSATESAEVFLYYGYAQSFQVPTYVETGTAHTFRIAKTSSSPDTYSIYVDGVLKQSSALGWSEQDANIARVDLATGKPYTNEESYVDDIDCSWTSGPQPSFLFDFIDPHGLWLNVTVSSSVDIDFSPVEIGPSDVCLASLPDGYLPAKPIYFDTAITAGDPVIGGTGRIYYTQSSLASQVYENSLTVLFWDPSNSTWRGCNARLNKELNYVEFDFDASGRYVLAGQPKQNYEIIIMIVAIGCVAAVSGVVYQKRKKITAPQARLPSRGKKVSNTRYEPAAGRDSLASKRARLMATSQPDSPAIAGDGSPAPPAIPKANPERVENVDIQARVKNAQQMLREVEVQDQAPACIVHKGPVSGLNYKCRSCGALYCLDCATHLARAREPCWNCGDAFPPELVAINPPPGSTSPDSIPDTTLSMFSRDVWSRLLDLEREGILEKDIFDEIVATLKDIPPGERLSFLKSGLFSSPNLAGQEDDGDGDGDDGG